MESFRDAGPCAKENIKIMLHSTVMHNMYICTTNAVLITALLSRFKYFSQHRLALLFLVDGSTLATSC